MELQLKYSNPRRVPASLPQNKQRQGGACSSPRGEATLSRGKMVNATISVVAMVNARLGTTGDTNEAWPKASGQRRLVAATLADYADPARCHADSLCLRVHAMEPTMPIAPKLADGIVNPCIETKDGALHNPIQP